MCHCPLQTPDITRGDLCPPGVSLSLLSLPLRVAGMGSVGAERFKELSPAVTPEGNVVMSFSFDSYQLEEDELQRGSQAKAVLTFMEPGEGRHGPSCPTASSQVPCCFPPHLGASWDGFNSHK